MACNKKLFLNVKKLIIYAGRRMWLIMLWAWGFNKRDSYIETTELIILLHVHFTTNTILAKKLFNFKYVHYS